MDPATPLPTTYFGLFALCIVTLLGLNTWFTKRIATSQDNLDARLGRLEGREIEIKAVIDSRTRVMEGMVPFMTTASNRLETIETKLLDTIIVLARQNAKQAEAVAAVTIKPPNGTP